MPTTTEPVVRQLPQFERALAEGDAGTAVGIVDELLDSGVEPAMVMIELISEAQRRIGDRWQRGEWSVAQEHTATGVSVAATEAIARRVRATPVSRGRIVIGCAEREWHALPALVIATGLRERGWNVTFLGASTPADRLSAYLHDLGPDAAAVSCSIVGALPSTRQFIEASTGAGIPVVAGGAAFGPDDRRARALGATAWAPGLREAVEIVDTLPAVVAPAEPLPAAALAEQQGLELAHRTVGETLRERWRPQDAFAPGTAKHADLVTVARDCVDQSLYTLQGALLTGDGRIVRDTAGWVAALLAARAVPGDSAPELAGELARVLRDYPRAVELLRAHWPERS
ncbi:cobalamin B12-binding domain-containing protein [Prauserella cavernicola]|uniref:Cobalamin-dependent protein n=1 Tax=Prauserella cavernicola TaxID=2800127 RepID=A0A934QYS6_9PSEU|nr:cobalamin-dependent protein [Prauserella cavernicola]MBK1787748.1 cobalamin-dependent protein [Prauserella cavernicola]